MVYGESDKIGAYVKDKPVTPQDFSAIRAGLWRASMSARTPIAAAKRPPSRTA